MDSEHCPPDNKHAIKLEKLPETEIELNTPRTNPTFGAVTPIGQKPIPSFQIKQHRNRTTIGSPRNVTIA